MEKIRQNNLRRIGLESETLRSSRSHCLLLYVYETSSSEAALYTMYTLVTEYQDWLMDVVVVIDPMKLRWS